MLRIKKQHGGLCTCCCKVEDSLFWYLNTKLQNIADTDPLPVVDMGD